MFEGNKIKRAAGEARRSFPIYVANGSESQSNSHKTI